MHSLLLSLLYRREGQNRTEQREKNWNSKTRVIILALTEIWHKCLVWECRFCQSKMVHQNQNNRFHFQYLTPTSSCVGPILQTSLWIYHHHEGKYLLDQWTGYQFGLNTEQWTCDVFLIIFKLGPRVDCKANDRASSRRFLSTSVSNTLAGSGLGWTGPTLIWVREERGGGLWPLLQSVLQFSGHCRLRYEARGRLDLSDLHYHHQLLLQI